MAPTEDWHDANLSVPIPANSVIRTQIQPHHLPSNLPYDIFLMIAFLCWDRESDDQDSNFPITASHVCRTWRRYALDTGAFWTSLEFRQQNPHRAIMKYKIWLERSKSSPLDIFIGSEPFKGASIKHAKSIMRLIMPHVEYWRLFQVERVPKKIVRLIFDRLRDVSAPMLETLKVFGERLPRLFRPVPTTKWKLAPFLHEGVPSLKELAVEAFPYGDLVNRFGMLQVLHLVHSDFFSAGGVENVKFIHHILVSLPDLRALQIDCARSEPYNLFLHRPLSEPSSRISHSSLTELSVYLPNADRDIVFSSLILPKVRYFLTRMHIEATLGLSLLPLLSGHRPFPNLISLRLGGTHSPLGVLRDPSNQIYLTQLEGALAGLPQLKALTFDHVDFERNKGLTCLKTSCPRLYSLAFIQCDGCTLLALRVIVEIRRTRPGFDPLVQLDIQQWPSQGGIIIDEETDSWMKRSLIYKVASPESDRSDYLSVVEGVKPSNFGKINSEGRIRH